MQLITWKVDYYAIDGCDYEIKGRYLPVVYYLRVKEICSNAWMQLIS